MARAVKKSGKRSIRSAFVRCQGADYEMFEVSEISGESAFLTGPLVLEVGEALTLKLTFGDGTELEVKAEVESAILGGGPGEDSGVRVSFGRAIDRQSIAQKLA